jgi:hypothetical protein
MTPFKPRLVDALFALAVVFVGPCVRALGLPPLSRALVLAGCLVGGFTYGMWLAARDLD